MLYVDLYSKVLALQKPWSLLSLHFACLAYVYICTCYMLMYLLLKVEINNNNNNSRTTADIPYRLNVTP